MTRTLRMMLRTSLLAAVGLGLVALAAGPALAALSAPGWLPMQPMLAGNQIIAMWLPVPGAVKYILYINGEKVAESPANQWMGAAPDKAGVYKYEITAVDGAGAESPKSVPGLITIVSLEPPAKPIFRPDDVEKNVQLRWTAAPGAVVYNVYRAEAKDGPWNLLQSIQEMVYKDSAIEFDKTYFYAVSAKDVTGKESGKSEAVEVKIKTPKKVVVKSKKGLFCIPTKEKEGIDFLGELEVGRIAGFIEFPGGRRLAVFGANYILEITNDMQPVQAWVWPGVPDPKFEKIKANFVQPPRGVDLPQPMLCCYMEFIDNDTLLVVDQMNSRILEFDLNRGEFTWVSNPLPKPSQEQDPKTWDAQLESARPRGTVLVSAIKLPNGYYWVTEGTGNIWMEVTPKGEISRWWAFFLEGEEGEEPSEKRLQAAQFLRIMPNGYVFAFVGADRHGYVFDPKTMFIKEVIGADNPTETGGYLGFTGGYVTADLKYLVMSDAGLGAVYLYDWATLEYLGSFGSEEGKPDPGAGYRPIMTDFAAAGLPILDKGGKRLFLYMGNTKYFSVRDVLIPLPVPTPKAAKPAA